MYEDIVILNSVRKQFDLTGRTAVITGGAGFLGIQFAEAIVEMGGKSLLIDINEKQLAEAGKKLNNNNYDNFSTYLLDITDERKCKEIYNKIWQENRGIDILINSAALTKAGIEDLNSDSFAPFEDTDQNLWEAGLKANLTATQLACKILGKKMVVRGKGNIINIASDIGVISPNQNIYEPDDHGYEGVDFNSPAFYAVSKAGVIHLTKYLATYWAKKNVRVNCISPAGVYRDHDSSFVKKLSEQIPMGRMALPNEFKGAIAYLASDASSFVTGHNLIIDGGRTIW
jgi:NAD(P)-dependent dehydrogenase (short-subunit alcohol dehydrogenase family)